MYNRVKSFQMIRGGEFHGSILRKVQGQERDGQPNSCHNEEWQASNTGHMFCMWN
jgi:hypothetical protein